mmetsp:Transcript_50655/g.134944  ORF Transcript_50655/g.134944 Transcript_50655/m.134944 type:complete len:219 (-) Transcript_50655:4626-5282(-)
MFQDLNDLSDCKFSHGFAFLSDGQCGRYSNLLHAFPELLEHTRQSQPRYTSRVRFERKLKLQWFQLSLRKCSEELSELLFWDDVVSLTQILAQRLWSSSFRQRVRPQDADQGLLRLDRGFFVCVLEICRFFLQSRITRTNLHFQFYDGAAGILHRSLRSAFDVIQTGLQVLLGLFQSLEYRDYVRFHFFHCLYWTLVEVVNAGENLRCNGQNSIDLSL